MALQMPFDDTTAADECIPAAAHWSACRMHILGSVPRMSVSPLLLDSR